MAQEQLRAWQARLADIAGSGIGRALSRALGAVALDAEREAKLNATSRLRVRSGHLRRSIIAKVAGPTLTLSANAPYAAAQEYGATITPKAGKYLTQPIGPALTAAGVPKFTSARQVPGLRFIRSKAGTPLLVDAQGTPWYVLHTRVKIKPKRYLRDAIATARGNLSRELAVEIRNELLGRTA